MFTGDVLWRCEVGELHQQFTLAFRTINSILFYYLARSIGNTRLELSASRNRRGRRIGVYGVDWERVAEWRIDLEGEGGIVVRGSVQIDGAKRRLAKRGR